MLARTGFPQYLESIAIGTSPEFLEKRTDLCDVANDFPQEVNLTYMWKKFTTSKEPIKELKQFAKHFMLDGPDLDPEFILHYVDKVKTINPWLATQMTRDVQKALDIAEREAERGIPSDRGVIYSDPKTEIASRDFDREKDLPDDPNFMDKLANLMGSCNAPGNYFVPISDKIGTVFDFNRINSDAAGLVDDGDLSAPPPMGIGSNIINKIAAPIQDVLFNAYTGAKLIKDSAKSVFMSDGERQNIAKLNREGIGADRGGALPIGATSTSVFQDAMVLNSKMVSKVRKNLKDNFRVFDHLNRYNAFDVQMNLAQANRRALKVMMRTPYSNGQEVPVRLTPQGVAAGTGNELKENNVTPHQALDPCVAGDSKRFDDTTQQTKSAYVPTSTSSEGPVSGQKLSDGAKSMIGVSTKEIPGTNNGNFGCAAAVSMMYKQSTGEDILPGRSMVLSTNDLLDGMSQDSRFIQVDSNNIQPGDILVTARGRLPGHTGIATENGMMIDNNSKTGSIHESTIKNYMNTVVTRNPTQFKVFRRKD